MMRPPALRPSSFVTRHAPRGFTLLELLVICLILAVLVLMLGPALARSLSGSTALQCMNNHRQLCAAWRMYADDNRDRILYASDDGNGTPYQPNAPPSPYSQNNYAWTWSKMDFYSGNPYNWDPAADMTLRLLWSYAGKETNLFKCPSDRSYVVVNGQAAPRVRSVSMNFYLGGFAGSASGSSFPGANNYQLYTKLSAIGVPNKTFVFLDQRADNINWGSFLTDMTGYSNNPAAYKFNEDLPGFYHDQGCTFSFVDGHVKEKRWIDPRTTPPPNPNGSLGGGPSFPSPSNPDVGWLQDHATRPR